MRLMAVPDAGLAKKNQFKFEYAKDGRHARGALDSDPNLRELRTELVPSALSEGAFWDEYFFHVDRLSMAANSPLSPSVERGPELFIVIFQSHRATAMCQR
mmetsp:Transcript_20094/g.80763  ORF Transcript_20094/g.80763 Transcript_20094/m.80763 type:complete len:101 (-) Transcript_20094:1896-2198(-)